MVKTNGLTKAEVLRALYNRAQPLGMGFLQFVPGDMEPAEAEQLAASGRYGDYVRGRVMKVNLDRVETDGHFDEYGYDRDNGRGTAQRAIDEFRTQGR